MSIVGQETDPISPPWRPETDGIVDQAVSAAADAIRTTRYHPGLAADSGRYRRDHELTGRARRLDPALPDDRDPDERRGRRAARTHCLFGSGTG